MIAVVFTVRVIVRKDKRQPIVATRLLNQKTVLNCLNASRFII